MASDHIVKSFDDQLNRLGHVIAEMGGLAEVQLADAMQALIRRDTEKALRVALADKRIDDLESEVDHLAVSLLALRQPMAQDLRDVIGALKVSAMIERVGDYAKNLAKRTAALAEVPPVPPAFTVARLGRLAQEMFKESLDSYISRDLGKADRTRDLDEEADALYTSIFRELLTYMMEDPRNITSCTHLLFVAKNLERVGDHATNIAEMTHFRVHGKAPAVERVKDDESSFTVVRPASNANE
jgi:phosphate transport system protein